MKIATIIPAFNEESRIGNVINVVKQVDIIDEIIVVDDGSIDMTYKIAQDKGVQVIRLKENKGKGAAIIAGINHTKADIILLLDADLIGLTPKHIINLIKPLQDKKYQMSYGVFCNGRFGTDLAQKIIPCLTGQRAIKREIFEKIPNLELTRYGVEIALTKYVKKNNIPSIQILLKNMTHVTKEEKLGLIRGLSARIKMYWEVLKAIKIFKFYD
ncbi:glycosyltransferase family 2 protein [Garciella nitratireducens]|uniref:Glucosyl-3-phosphoglycerate synthase n=1 Tax=Garciella nitratireducens DSM 15102 TaxID=1121911 RepID=A0A1T4JWZ5_9FIRM|nr:glycosyltransferase family 2 protein [Garciella nitratireducens]SJZ34617.1 Glycosyl transferase family 2 [Garciella nitratireducens DSM 15102]